MKAEKAEKIITWILVAIVIGVTWFLAIQVTLAFWSQMSFSSFEGLVTIALIASINAFAWLASEFAIMIREDF